MLFMLINRLKQNFPVFREPVETNSNLAAVMVILYEKYSKPYILLIRRSPFLKIHGGEIGFPGGRYETKDGDLFETARRETREEMGLWIEDSLIIGRLPTVTTARTAIEIAPFVAVIDHAPIYTPNPSEVEEVFDIPLIPLLSTQAPDRSFHRSLNMVDFWYRENRIWGASAKILRQLTLLQSH